MTSSISPGRSQKAVTPDDDNDLPDGACKALEVIADGDVATIAEDDADDAPVTRSGLTAGRVIEMRVRRVLATGTTATVLAIY
jgi:hypothetical protein